MYQQKSKYYESMHQEESNICDKVGRWIVVTMQMLYEFQYLEIEEVSIIADN